jgi:hypothetical protein
MAYQGIGTANMLKHRVGADDATTNTEDAEDEAIATAYQNRCCIPLDFELIESHMPFYQSGLGDKLEYGLTFNEYDNVIVSSDDYATYTISNISLEFDSVTEPELARTIGDKYNNKLVILYDRILRHRDVPKNKSDTVWNINLNVSAKSIKGILMLFEDPTRTSSEQFYNPKITKVEVTIDGVPNQIYSQGVMPWQQWDDANKYFVLGSKRSAVSGQVESDLMLSSMSIGKYLTNKFCLWLDLRSTDDNSLYGSGRRIENASEGMTIRISKTAEIAGVLNVLIYVLMDAQINFDDGRFISAIY